MKELINSLAALSLLFVLFACGSKKTIETSEIADLTMNSVLLNGKASMDAILAGGEVGFIISEIPNPSLENGEKLYSSQIEQNGKYSVKITWLKPSTIYYYVAFLNNGMTSLLGDIKQFTTKDFELLAVDMGLSVKWANANLGANSPEDYGDYFAWGETKTKKQYTQKNAKFHYLISTCYQNEKAILKPEDDVAHVILGDNWRMPKKEEEVELLSTQGKKNYTWEIKNINDHTGWLITYLVNGNTLFLPFGGRMFENRVYYKGIAGYYWSSCHATSDLVHAGTMYLTSEDYPDNQFGVDLLYHGQMIRPVTE